MGEIVSQITSLTIVYSTVYSNQIKSKIKSKNPLLLPVYIISGQKYTTYQKKKEHLKYYTVL